MKQLPSSSSSLSSSSSPLQSVVRRGGFSTSGTSENCHRSANIWSVSLLGDDDDDEDENDDDVYCWFLGFKTGTVCDLMIIICDEDDDLYDNISICISVHSTDIARLAGLRQVRLANINTMMTIIMAMMMIFEVFTFLKSQSLLKTPLSCLKCLPAN